MTNKNKIMQATSILESNKHADRLALLLLASCFTTEAILCFYVYTVIHISMQIAE